MDTLGIQLIVEYLNEISDEMLDIIDDIETDVDKRRRWDILEAKGNTILYVVHLLGYSLDLGYENNKCVYTGMHKVV